MAHRIGAVYTRYRYPVVAFMHFHVQFSGLIHYLYTNVYTEKEGRKIYSSLAASKADRME